MSWEEFDSRVRERRQITGETYAAAAKALLAYLGRSLTDDQRREFERLAKGH